MSTLTYSHTDHAAAAAEAQARTPTHKSFWRRLFGNMMAAQQRRADREIAAYIARRGGYLTDEVERDIMRNLGNGGRVTRISR